MCSCGAGLLCLMKTQQSSRRLACVTLFPAAVSAGLKVQRGVWTTEMPPLYNNFLHEMHTIQLGFCNNVWCVCILHEKSDISRKATKNPLGMVRPKWVSRNEIWIGFQTTYECILKRICKNCFTFLFFCHSHLVHILCAFISPFFTSLWAWSNRSHECRINTECSHGSHTSDGQSHIGVLINFEWHHLYRETRDISDQQALWQRV